MIVTSECRSCNSMEDRIVLYPRYRIMKMWSKRYVICSSCGVKNDVWLEDEGEPIRHRVLNMMWKIRNIWKIKIE